MPEDTSSANSGWLQRLRAELGHAFAVERGTEDELNEEELETLEKLARRVVKMNMAVPAIMFLESVRPLNYLGSQVMLFFRPLLGIASETVNLATAPLLGFSVDVKFYNRLQEVLEKRASVEALIVRIEQNLNNPVTGESADNPEEFRK
ncbi:hypothetical protein J7J84_03270 [bacterium]|nr:hypothetical protein [bacterium]